MDQSYPISFHCYIKLYQLWKLISYPCPRSNNDHRSSGVVKISIRATPSIYWLNKFSLATRGVKYTNKWKPNSDPCMVRDTKLSHLILISYSCAQGSRSCQNLWVEKPFLRSVRIASLVFFAPGVKATISMKIKVRNLISDQSDTEKGFVQWTVRFNMLSNKACQFQHPEMLL